MSSESVPFPIPCFPTQAQSLPATQREERLRDREEGNHYCCASLHTCIWRGRGGGGRAKNISTTNFFAFLFVLHGFWVLTLSDLTRFPTHPVSFFPEIHQLFGPLPTLPPAPSKFIHENPTPTLILLLHIFCIIFTILQYITLPFSIFIWYRPNFLLCSPLFLVRLFQRFSGNSTQHVHVDSSSLFQSINKLRDTDTWIHRFIYYSKNQTKHLIYQHMTSRDPMISIIIY